jgi:hypothetical protein
MGNSMPLCTSVNTILAIAVFESSGIIINKHATAAATILMARNCLIVSPNKKNCHGVDKTCKMTHLPVPLREFKSPCFEQMW